LIEIVIYHQNLINHFKYLNLCNNKVIPSYILKKMNLYDEHLYDLKNILSEFVSDLKDNIFVQPNEQNDFIMMEFFVKSVEPDIIMNNVIDTMLPHKKNIVDRNMSFFIKNKEYIFLGMPLDKVDYYIDVLTDSNRTDDDNLSIIWDYFDVMIDIAEKYKKNK